jgi:ParB family chromosome partitioning protein
MAARVGKNRSTVANALRLLRLPEEIQESLIRGELSSGHGRAVLQAAKAEDRETLFREIRERGLSVREAERRAAELNGEPAESPGAEVPKTQEEPAGKPEKGPASRAAELADMEEKLIEKFGTKVSVQGTLEKGSIRIEYYSMDDLGRLYDIILRN